MTTPTTAEASSTELNGRPDFLVRMGLLLPCTPDDVQAAYRVKAMLAHPDKGGSVDAFTQLQSDYEAALEFAKFHSSRRGWLAASIERYAEQETIVAEIQRRGGSVEMQSTEWMAREIGPDFAQVLDRVVGVCLRGSQVTNADVQYLVAHQHILSTVRKLDLTGARIGNTAVELLSTFPNLNRLVLNGTSVGDMAVNTLGSMKTLRTVEVAHTFVSRLGRFRLRYNNRELDVVGHCQMDTRLLARRRLYRWVVRLLLLYLLVVFIATHVPPSFLPKTNLRSNFPIPLDKIAHFSMYFGLAFLLACVLSLRNPERRRLRTGLSMASYAIIWVVLALYGIVDETTQPLTGRSFDWDDWLADLSGITSGLAVFAIMQLIRMRRSSASRDSLESMMTSTA